MGACHQKVSDRKQKENQAEVNQSLEIPKEQPSILINRLHSEGNLKGSPLKSPAQKENSPSAAQRVRPSADLKTPVNTSDVQISMVKSSSVRSPEQRVNEFAMKIGDPSDFGDQKKTFSPAFRTSNVVVMQEALPMEESVLRIDAQRKRRRRTPKKHKRSVVLRMSKRKKRKSFKRSLIKQIEPPKANDQPFWMRASQTANILIESTNRVPNTREAPQHSTSRSQPRKPKLLASSRANSMTREDKAAKVPMLLTRAHTPFNTRQQTANEPRSPNFQAPVRPTILVINNLPLTHIQPAAGDKDNDSLMDVQSVLASVQGPSATLSLPQDFKHHAGVTCKVCAYTNFRVTRYKCLQCVRYDLCANCFESRQYSGRHTWEHLVLPIIEPLDERAEAELEKSLIDKTIFTNASKPHKKKICSICRAVPIQGVRVSCDACTAFDVCWRCYNEQAHMILFHHQQHPFVAYLAPVVLVDGPEDVDLGDKVSEGGFGIVYKGKVRSSGQSAAIKRMTLQMNDGGAGMGVAEQYLTEVRAYADLNSTYLVKFLGCYTVVSGELEGLPELRYYILTEFMDNGSLRDVINKRTALDLFTKFNMMHQVIKGLRRIHSKNYIHKDIKPENVFVSRHFEAKIGDMGLMVQHQPGQFNSLGGTLRYMAPELLHWMQFGAGIYDPSVDIYSFALVFHEFFTYQPLGDHGVMETPFFLSTMRQCLGVHNRPTAWDIDKLFDAFSDFFWRTVGDFSRYQSLDIAMRNDVFVRVYEFLYNTRINSV